jgi:WD40 repeat protein
LHGSGEVRAYRVEDGEALWSVTFDSGIYAVDVHPGGQRIAAAGFEGVVHLLDAADGHIVRDFLSVPLRSEDGAASEAVEASLPHQEDV